MTIAELQDTQKHDTRLPPTHKTLLGNLARHMEMPDRIKGRLCDSVAIGNVGEYLTLAKLLKFGINASLAPTGHKTDIFADLGDPLGVLRIQVKTAFRATGGAKSQNASYKYSLRGSAKRWIKADRNRTYQQSDYDIAAFVAFDIERIFFLPYLSVTGKTIRASRMQMPELERDTLDLALTYLAVLRGLQPMSHHFALDMRRIGQLSHNDMLALMRSNPAPD